MKYKKKHGDRKDAALIRDLDALHSFMPFLIPNRADNEAVLNDEIDISNVLKYIEEKNASNPDFKYTVFHFIVAALAKTIYLRPNMNRFIQGHRYYLRDDISFSFVVKKKFEDRSEESLAIVKVDPDSSVSPIEQIHSAVEKKVTHVRRENKNDGTTEIIEKFKHIPRFILRFFSKILFFADYHDLIPASLLAEDPYHTTCFISNLGSIKMSASYHHLTNWGTNSFFVIVGEMKDVNELDATGNVKTKRVVPIGMTIDERIADGFYFAKSVKLLRKIFENPTILDKPFNEIIDIQEN